MVDLSALTNENLRLSPDGVWCSSDAQSGHHRLSYPDDGNDVCFRIEEESFWFHHRNNCIVESVTRFRPNGPFFDVGGGNGFVAQALEHAGLEVVLVEPGAHGARNAQIRGLKNVVCATFDSAQFSSSRLPAVGLFDVLEHIEDDHGFLRAIHNALCPDGRVYVTVPAIPWLWSDEDEYAGHFRRYTRASVRDVLKRAGFNIEYLTGIFRPLPVAILLGRVLPYRLGIHGASGTGELCRQHVVRSRSLNKVISWLLDCEIELIRRGRTSHFGASWLVVGRKP
jgi:SAM-dependent methyltransferase